MPRTKTQPNQPQPPQRRYVPVSEYMCMSGLSYPTVKSALESGQLKGVQTETGRWRIDVANQDDNAALSIFERLDDLNNKLAALCKHLGIS